MTEPVPPAGDLHVVVGAGPVGAAVAREALQRGHPVRIVTRSGDPGMEGAQWRRADVGVATEAEEAVEGAAVVYAAMNAPYHRWAEEFPPLQASLLAATASVGAVYAAVENVYAYGRVDHPMHENLPLRPCSRKGEVRAEMTRALFAAHTAGRVRAVAVRASDFYGPGATLSAAGDRFFPPILAGRTVRVLGDPDALHTQTYVPDIARALVTVATDPDAHGRAWHAPNAPAVSQREFAHAAYAVAGTSGRVTTTPKLGVRALGLFVPEVREMVEMLYEFEHDFVVDSSAYTARYGTRATPIEEGLAATVAWYRDR